MRKLLFIVLLCGISMASFAQKKTVKPESPQAGVVKELITSLSQSDFDHAWSMYDESIKKLLGVEQIKKTWQDTELRNGKFVKILHTRSEVQNGIEVLYTSCLFQDGKVKFKTTINGSKEVTSFLILKETQK